MTDIFGSLGDAFGDAADAAGDAFGAVGDAAGSVGRFAQKWILPTTERRGESLSLGSFRRSADETFQRSLPGSLIALPDILQNEETSIAEKLLWGTLIAAGAGLTARELSGIRAAERSAMLPIRSTRQGGILRAFKNEQRYMPSTPAGEAVKAARPGITARAADILGAFDEAETFDALVRKADDVSPLDPLVASKGAAFIQLYKAGLTEFPLEQRLGIAQHDLAKFEVVMSSNLVRKSKLKQNQQVVALWEKFTNNPMSVSDEEMSLLAGHVRSVGDATRGVDVSMSIGPVTAVSNIDFLDDGSLIVFLKSPTDWDELSAVSADVRNQRLKELNLRALVEQGRSNILYLYELGMSNEAMYLDRTSDWYRNVNAALVERLEQARTKLPWLNLDALSAAVSLSSEATDWEENIDLALTALMELVDDPDNMIGNSYVASALKGMTKAEDGFSISVRDGSTPSAGWAVSRSGRGIRIKASELLDRNGNITMAAATRIRQMLLANKDELRTAATLTVNGVEHTSADVVLGGYLSPDGYVYLDVTDIFSEEMGEDVARMIGMDRNQQSIANVGRIGTDEQAFFDTGGSGGDLLDEAELASIVAVPLSDMGFQKWLVDGSGDAALIPGYQRLLEDVHLKLTGSDAKPAYNARMAEAKAKWKKIPKDERPDFEEFFDEPTPGNKLKIEELRKILTLFSISGEDLFSRTDGQKQINFWLNLLNPDNPFPYTIDRHMMDILLGLATASDFKWMARRSLGEREYDVLGDMLIAATRELNDRMGLTGSAQALMPHQVQGVVWQAWRVLKSQWGEHGWGSAKGPARIFGPNGEENPAFDLLRGRFNPTMPDPYSVTPKRVTYVMNAGGDGLAIKSDGIPVVLAQLTKDNADRLRHLVPMIETEEGPHLWGAGVPVRVASTAAVRRDLEQAGVAGAVTEEWLTGAFGDVVHPAMSPKVTIIVDAPESGLTLKGNRFSVVVPSGRAVVSEPQLSPPRGLRQVTVAEFVHARRTLERSGAQKGSGTPISTMLSEMPGDEEMLAKWGKHRFWLNEEGTAGFAIDPDGDLQQVFNNSGVRGYGGEMVQWARANGARSLDFYDGEFAPDPSMPPIVGPDGHGYLKGFYERNGFKETESFDWNPEFDPKGRPNGPRVVFMKADEPEVTAAARKATSTRRVAVVQKDSNESLDLDKLIEEIEAAGGKVRVVYSRSAPGKGFVQARDHLYQDGVNLLVVRSRDPELTSLNGFMSWVPEADAQFLPDRNPLGQQVQAKPARTQAGPIVRIGNVATADSIDALERDGVWRFTFVDTVSGAEQLPHISEITGTALETRNVLKKASKADRKAGKAPTAATVGGNLGGGMSYMPDGLDVEVRNGTYVVEVTERDPTDAVYVVNALMRMGVEPDAIELRLGSAAVSVPFDVPASARRKGSVLTVRGTQVPGFRRTGKINETLMGRYGVEMDPYYRDPKTRQQLRIPEEFLPHFEEVLDRTVADPVVSEMLHLVRWTQIGVAGEPIKSVKGNWMAWTTPSSVEGPPKIVLPATLWSDVGRVTATVEASIADGHLVPTLPATPAYILMHELGHVLDAALAMSFRRKGDYITWRTAAIGQVRKKLGKKGVSADLSRYANESIEEFMAEAIAEAVFSPSPRPLALQVWSMVTEQFRANQATMPSLRWSPNQRRTP